MKNLKIFGLILIPILLIVAGLNLTYNTYQLPSKEISINLLSPFGNAGSKIVAASCGILQHGSSDEYSTCTATCPDGSSKSGLSQCGGACTADCGSCSNGAVNPPSCTTCGQGSSMVNGSCKCANGASNSPACNACPTGLAIYNNLCVCANGATDTPTCNICPSGSVMQGGQCTCNNGATPQSNCSICPTGQVMYQNKCTPGCDLTNACGLKSQGVMLNGTCSTPDGTNVNNSCVTNFRIDLANGTVNPGGGVEFFWKIAPLPKDVSAKCGFVDLTTPTPRPIPGLQNLDPTVDRARISNVQITSRFCLVCQFYSLVNNNSLGDAVIHQWIRVIKIGEI